MRPKAGSGAMGISQHVNRPGRYQPEQQLPGGIRTHQESAPFHVAL